jgi:hypothetical protein
MGSTVHMRRCSLAIIAAGLVGVAGTAIADDVQYLVNHSECTYFGARHKEFVNTGLMRDVLKRRSGNVESFAGATTRAVTSRLAPAVDSSSTSQPSASVNTIDKYIFPALTAAGVAPAAPTTDYEFVRRVYLDLTGRVPTVDQLQQFIGSTDPAKRAKLIDSLIGSHSWIDKWTMYYGDLLKNNSNQTSVRRFPEGRDAFYRWIYTSLTENKPYDQMARELISAQGENTFQQGELNWLIGARVTGGPIQDIWDQMASNTAETFLGLANLNCLECHNGRGHLDTINLWGSQTTRQQAWQMSAFFSKAVQQYTADPNVKNYGYWGIVSSKSYPGTYALNTTTGNRPARQPIGSTRSVTPVYMFNGDAPAQGDNYQAALAKEVTSDFQFARASVNYIWKEFFGLGIVEPTNQFDPARLDPNNPPPSPWTLQPANPALLDALAKDFVASGFDIQALMREITNSQAYQLSSRYDPAAWNPQWETLFARHLVRRLWAEEIHDAIVQTSNVVPAYNIPDYGVTSWAMAFPETLNMPGSGSGVSLFLNSFLRGDRDTAVRSDQLSIPQALNIMNDPVVMTRVRASGTAAKPSLLLQNINKAPDQLVTNLFLTVLSRNPTPDELQQGINSLQSGTRTQTSEDLLWSLYNKVDFLFNY